MDDRRAQQRANLNLEVVWAGASGYHQARIRDLTESGCYIDSFGTVVTGEILRFEIQLSEDERLYFEGEAVHSTPDVGFGLRFVNLDDEQLQKIRRVIGAGAPADDTATSAHNDKEIP